MAYTRVDFTNAAGELVAYGRKTCVLTRKVMRKLIASTPDHTKYVGKSSSDPVSNFDNIFLQRLDNHVQNNVKFSEDGERVIEGNDVD